MSHFDKNTPMLVTPAVLEQMIAAKVAEEAEKLIKPEWLSLKAMAKMIGLTPDYARRLSKAGGPPRHTIGRRLRFKRSEIEAWLEEKSAA